MNRMGNKCVYGKQAGWQYQSLVGAVWLVAPVLAVGTMLAGGTAALAADAGLALEEIVVTSQKRAENLQSVPLAVSVIGQDAIGDLGITRFDGISVPGVHITEGGSNNVQFIRGIGSSFNDGYEQSAPLYSDGVWLGRSQSQRLAFLDVQRIEILKGPQPTYLGKNAIAGATSIVSKRPTQEFEAGIDAMYGFQAQEISTTAYISGPLSDKVSARFAGRYDDMAGYMKNIVSGKNEAGREDIAGRLSLLLEPTDNFEIWVKGEYSRFQERGRVTQLVKCLPGGQFDPAIEDCKFDLKRASSYDPSVYDSLNDPFFDHSRKEPDYRDIEFKSTALEANWDVNEYIITILSSYYKQEDEASRKVDHSTRQRAANQTTEDYDLFSSELRVASPTGRTIEWLAGAYYDSVNQASDNHTIIPTTQTGTVSQANQDAKSWSVFAEVGVYFTEQLKVKAAGRYTKINKTADLLSETYSVTPLATTFISSISIQDVKVKDDSFDPGVTIEWTPNDDYLIYSSWRKGFKAAGIDLDITSTDPAELPFASENVTYYEAGVKASIQQNATINLAIFRGDYKDLQSSVIDVETGQFATTNAGKVRSQGVEVEALWRVTDSLTLNAAVAYLDSTYRDFSGVACYNNPAQTVAEGCILVSPGVRAQDLTGARTPYAPKWSGNIGANLRQPLDHEMFGSKVELVGRTDVYLTSKYQIGFNNDPDTVQNGFGKIDARLGIAAEDARWELAVVGRNITNKLTAAFMGNQPRSGQNSAHFVITERPREVFLQLKVRFD